MVHVDLFVHIHINLFIYQDFDLWNLNFLLFALWRASRYEKIKCTIRTLFSSVDFGGYRVKHWASQVALVVKNLPANTGDIRGVIWVSNLVQFLGWKDSLEEVMANYSSIVAWRIPWAEDPGGLLSTGSQKARYNWSDLACSQGTGANDVVKLPSSLWTLKYSFFSGASFWLWRK